MADSQINWRQGDFIRLGQAVSRFNKKINELQTEEKKLLKPKNDVVFQSIFNQNNTLNKEYTAVILGDITGNGIVDVGDVAKLYQHIRGSFEMKKE